MFDKELLSEIEYIIDFIDASKLKYCALPFLADNQNVINAEYYTLINIYKNKKELEIDEITLNYFYFYFDGICSGMPLRKPTPEGGLNEVTQHDDMVALACRDKQYAWYMINYGIKHFGLYDQRPNKPYKFPSLLFNKKEFIEFFRCLRQPYQMGMIQLGACGFCTPINYIHLILVVLIEVFIKKIDNTSGKMLLWIMSRNIRCFPSWLYKKLMVLKHGKEWETNIFRHYYGNTYPELFKLAKLIFEYEREYGFKKKI